MSEIRNRIVKFLEESKISFMEDIEAQPDLFGGEDTYYKDGKQAVGFMDVLDFMSEVAPDLDYSGDKQTKDLYWMIYHPTSSGVKIDADRVADIESKLAKRFGEGTVIVKLGNAPYAPEIKYLRLGFVDKADVEESVDDVKEGAINDVMQDGETSWESITQAADDDWSTGVEDTPDIEGATEDEAQKIEEGWKDNLKKGVATLGVAGALAGNAMAQDNSARTFDTNRLSPQQIEMLKNEEEHSVKLPNGMIQDQYGNEWTQDDWETLMRGEDPFEDNDYPPEEVEEAVESPAVDEVRKRLANEFVDLEVTGPTYDAYDPDEPRAGKTQYYIEVPEEFYEARDLERMLFEIQKEYPDFEYEGEDFSNRFWFVINEKSEE